MFFLLDRLITVQFIVKEYSKQFLKPKRVSAPPKHNFTSGKIMYIDNRIHIITLFHGNINV